MKIDPHTTEIVKAILDEYPSVARQIIQQYQDMSLPVNQSFARHPDDPAEHETRWHQFGIITHSERFQQILAHEVPAYLQKWSLWREVQKVLLAQIDGKSKWDLLQVTAVLHDVGKFAARQPGKGFRDHEVFSGQLIRTTLKPLLKTYSLTEAQIEYIARTAELHYELGKIRRKAKKTGYTIAFTQSQAFKDGVQTIQQQYPDFALEIGLLFLPDSISKTEIAATGETDAEVAGQQKALEKKMTEAKVNPIFINAAMQLPINIKVAEEYLKYWVKHRKKTMMWLALDHASRESLRKAFPSKYTQEFYHHVTLKANLPQEVVDKLAGTHHEVEAYAHAFNDDVEAVRVRTHNLPDTYGVPHITLSSRKGIEPFESVFMLKASHTETPISPPLKLSGVIEVRDI